MTWKGGGVTALSHQPA